MRSIFSVSALAIVLSLFGHGGLAVTFSCYTYTSTVGPPRCPPKPYGCVEPTCVVSTTASTTLPCPAKSCTTTPTVTTTTPCTGCRKGCYTTTSRVTTTSPCPDCYTATAALQPPPECPPYGCNPPRCTFTDTFTAPCKDPSCPQTPTVTLTQSCNPFCRTRCATSMTTVTETDCPPTPYY